jgi:hypothetical protein
VHGRGQRIAEARTADIERIAKLGQHLAHPAWRRMLLMKDEKDRLKHWHVARARP